MIGVQFERSRDAVERELWADVAELVESSGFSDLAPITSPLTRKNGHFVPVDNFDELAGKLELEPLPTR